MQPGEQSSNQPPLSRPPFPRRTRMSIDGVLSSPPLRRPLNSTRPLPGLQPTQRLVGPPRPQVAADTPSRRPAPPVTGVPPLPSLQSPPASLASPAPTSTPPEAAAEALNPTATVPAPAPTLPTAPSAPAPQQPKTFIPPPPPRQPKRWRRFLFISTAALLVLGVGGAIAVWLHVQSVRSNPLTVFNDALNSSLSTTQLQANTTAPTGNRQIDYDFTQTKNPLISSQSTVSLYGTAFQIAGYGSAQNTYVSYASFPPFITKNISSVAQAAWVQLRSKGVDPPTVSGTLNNLADPRYENFGPLVFGNFPIATRTRMVNFLLAQHMYVYQIAKVSKTTLNGAAVLAYPVTLNVNYLKIFVQSAAVSEGFAPNDVQAAVNALTGFKDSMATFYVSAKTHRFVRTTFRQNGQVTTTDYSDYNSATLLNEPETNLAWQDFAATQLQIEQQTAAHESASGLDGQRQADLTQLHNYLAAYYAAYSYYPTYPEVDDVGWVAANLPGLDVDALRDPLAAHPGIAAAPGAKTYSYQPLNPSGKSCTNDTSVAISQMCTSYTLTAVLSNSKQYTVSSP